VIPFSGAGLMFWFIRPFALFINSPVINSLADGKTREWEHPTHAQTD